MKIQGIDKYDRGIFIFDNAMNSNKKYIRKGGHRAMKQH